MSEPNTLEDQILHRFPRMSPDDCFQFHCGPELDCFTSCCADVAIVLTPYDVLRMKRARQMDSSEFLEKYTLRPSDTKQRMPLVLLKMDAESKWCPFVNEFGCSIYADRPWACRMYPLGSADPKSPTATEQPFHFVLWQNLCEGFGKSDPVTVREYLAKQGVEEYEAMGASFKELTLHDFWDKEQSLTPAQADMFYMACYDVDRFRRFVFETRFLQLFHVDEARVEAIRTDDEELLEFAMQWLRFCLFQEKTMKLRPAAAGARRGAAECAGCEAQ